MTDPDSKRRLADEMALDFERDLSADGLSLNEIKERIGRSNDRILQSPVIVVLCLDMDVMDTYPDPRRSQAEYIMGIQGVALAGGTLLLAAHAEGLGGVWMCAPLFAPETVLRALTLPPFWQPQGMLALGYPAEIPEPRPRRALSEVAVFR